MSEPPEFSIVTPSFNMLSYLQRCVASVGDQQGMRVEHLIMDGGSTDGTAEWLQSQDRLQSVSEPDDGMYDAINKGLRRARGAFVAYLNCDEQYLPGALASVRTIFDHRPSVDVIFGGALLVDPEGQLIAYRKAYPARRLYILSNHLYVLSCAMFFRRKVIESGFFFDSSYRAGGDADFVTRILGAGFQSTHLKSYLSTFTMTGGNLSEGETAQCEAKRLRSQAPIWARTCRPLLTLSQHLEKLAHGAYSERMPLHYAIYLDPGAPRERFTARHAGQRWRSSAVSESA